MSKNQKKLPQIHYFLKDKLAKLKEKQQRLLSELTVGSTPEQYRELSMTNYHIEVTENRMHQRFKDPVAGMEATLMKSNQIIYQKQQ